MTNIEVDTSLATLEHEGYTYRLQGSSLRFVVDFRNELNREQQAYGSARDAQEAIDQHRQAYAKARKLALPVLTSQRTNTGTLALQHSEITGVNLSTGRLTGLGKDVDRLDVYIDEPWVSDALRERFELQEQARAISEKLYAVKLADRFRTDVSKYAETLDGLEAEYARKAAAAKQS